MLQQNEIGFDLGFIRKGIGLRVGSGVEGAAHFRPDAFLSN